MSLRTRMDYSSDAQLEGYRKDLIIQKRYLEEPGETGR